MRLQATFRAYFENAKIGNFEGGSKGGGKDYHPKIILV